MRQLIEQARKAISEAQRDYAPRVTIALFSGGYDSLVSTHIALRSGVRLVAHVNTGIGIEETRQFVRSICKQRSWELVEVHTPESYEEIVLAEGFPGPPYHRKMYTLLKERAIRQLKRRFKSHRRDKILWITGIREQESVRRMGYQTTVHVDGSDVWLAPLYYGWGKQEIFDYKRAHQLPDNPVVEELGMSGECLCGAFARPGELERIRACSPATAERIDTLQHKVWEKGFPWGWEQRAPEWWLRQQGGQEALFDMQPDEESFSPLCSGCYVRKRAEIATVDS